MYIDTLNIFIYSILYIYRDIIYYIINSVATPMPKKQEVRAVHFGGPRSKSLNASSLAPNKTGV